MGGCAGGVVRRNGRATCHGSALHRSRRDPLAQSPGHLQARRHGQGHTVDRLDNRHHGAQAGGGRVEDDGAQAAPGATPRGDGNAGGRNRARLQQHPRSDPRLWRDGAARRAQGEPPRARPRQHHGRRRARARARRARAGVQPQRGRRTCAGPRRGGGTRGRSTWSRRSCRRT